MQDAASLIQAIFSWPVVILILIFVLLLTYRKRFAKWVEHIIERIAIIRVSGGGIQVDLERRIEGVNRSVDRMTDDVREFKVDIRDRFNQVMNSITQISVQTSAVAQVPIRIDLRDMSTLSDNVEADARKQADDFGLDLERSRAAVRLGLPSVEENAVNTLVHLVRDTEHLVGQLVEAALPIKKESLHKWRFSERARLLRQNNIISPGTFNAIQIIRDLRNKVVHTPGSVPTLDEMDEIITLGEWVLTSLNGSLEQQIKSRS